MRDTSPPFASAAAAIGALALLLSTGACAPKPSDAAEKKPGIDPQKAADMLHAVMEADRTVYTKMVVNRLIKEQKVQIVDPYTKETVAFGASEQWKSEHGKLPLPAQMFRMGSEHAASKDPGFTYVLLSKWPINQQNQPKTDMEVKGLEYVDQQKGKEPFYGVEELGGAKYFTAVYADVGVADACVDCHNNHADSPRNDFKIGDVMGGVVIRIPL